MLPDGRVPGTAPPSSRSPLPVPALGARRPGASSLPNRQRPETGGRNKWREGGLRNPCLLSPSEDARSRPGGPAPTSSRQEPEDSRSGSRAKSGPTVTSGVYSSGTCDHEPCTPLPFHTRFDKEGVSKRSPRPT